MKTLQVLLRLTECYDKAQEQGRIKSGSGNKEYLFIILK